MDKRALIIGTGISGAGAAKLLLEQGYHVTVLEQSTKRTPREVEQRFMGDLVQLAYHGREIPEFIYEDPSPEAAGSFVLAVPSPAVPDDSAILTRLKAAGVRIWSEIELGFEFARGRVIAITGTNGKTTTTSLVGAIAAAYGPSFIVGNIGYSYAAVAGRTDEDTLCVAEVSSFQMEHVEKFRPAASAILNITPDHLDRHHSMENYIACKERIAALQTKDEVCVLNYMDPELRRYGLTECPATVVFFSSGEEPEEGFVYRDRAIIRKKGGEETVLLAADELQLVGTCNMENVCAALALAEAVGIPMDLAVREARRFPPVEHRIEFVAEVGGVRYYNDSKGTNPDAAIQGIRAMDRPTVLIGGGYDKGSEYDTWIEAFDGKVKELVLIGQTKEKIAECARRHGFDRIRFCDTFEEALELCTRLAEPGDAVLLSPACASWGMFPNYEVRGARFKDYVYHLQ